MLAIGGISTSDADMAALPALVGHALDLSGAAGAAYLRSQYGQRR